MYQVKYYIRDKYLGHEMFQKLEIAEVSLYQSSFSFKADYYEIIDLSNAKIVQEFIIPTYEIPLVDEVGLLQEQ